MPLLSVNSTLSLDKGLSVLVELDLGDDNLGCVEVDGSRSTVGLLLGHLLDTDGVLETVHLGDLTLTALVGSSGNQNLVVLSDGQGADLVLLTELLRQRGGHDGSSLGRGSGEVSLPALSARRGHVLRYLHCSCVLRVFEITLSTIFRIDWNYCVRA